MEPIFIHHDLVKEGLSQVFGFTKQSVIVSDPCLKEMLSLIPITPNGITLLDGIMGIGKGVSTAAIQKVFFGNEKIGLLQCDPNKRQEEALYETSVRSLTSYHYNGEQLLSTTQDFDFSPNAMGFVSQPVKFANEINRASKSLQDTLLRLFQEYELEYKGRIFKSPTPFIAIFDQNPVHMQNDGRKLEPALGDRVDIKLPMPAPSLFTIIKTQTIKTSDKTEDTLPTLMNYEQMKDVFADVSRIKITAKDINLLSALTQMFFSCKHRKDIANEYFMENINCQSCSFDNGLCKHVKFPIGQRFIESIEKFAKSRAWLDKRSTVSIDDLLFILPFALNHRLELQPDTLSKYPDTYTWIQEHAMKVLEEQRPTCETAISSYKTCLLTPNQAIFESMFEKARNNMIFVRTLASILENQALRSQEALQKTIEIMDANPGPEQIFQLKEYLGKNGTLEVPSDKEMHIKILNDATSSSLPGKHYGIILDNKSEIEKLLKLYGEQTDKTLVFSSSVYAKDVYPVLISMCPASKADTVNKSLTEDAEFTIQSVKINVSHTSSEVTVSLSSKNTTKLAHILEQIEN